MPSLASSPSSKTTVQMASTLTLSGFPTALAPSSSLMEQLIITLKNKGVIRFVRHGARLRSASEVHGSVQQLQQLHRRCELSVLCDKYKARYNQVIQSLPVYVVGLSTQVSVDPNPIRGTTFYNYVEDIKNAGDNIAGVYLWNADHSKQLNNNFTTEKAVAAIL